MVTQLTTSDGWAEKMRVASTFNLQLFCELVHEPNPEMRLKIGFRSTPDLPITLRSNMRLSLDPIIKISSPMFVVWVRLG